MTLTKLRTALILRVVLILIGALAVLSLVITAVAAVWQWIPVVVFFQCFITGVLVMISTIPTAILLSIQIDIWRDKLLRTRSSNG